MSASFFDLPPKIRELIYEKQFLVSQDIILYRSYMYHHRYTTLSSL